MELEEIMSRCTDAEKACCAASCCCEIESLLAEAVVTGAEKAISWWYLLPFLICPREGGRFDFETESFASSGIGDGGGAGGVLLLLPCSAMYCRGLVPEEEEFVELVGTPSEEAEEVCLAPLAEVETSKLGMEMVSSDGSAAVAADADEPAVAGMGPEEEFPREPTTCSDLGVFCLELDFLLFSLLVVGGD